MENHDKYIGQMLDNRYEILEKIGTGGMAVVYKARCHRLNRLVAVKILKEELLDDEEFRRRFKAESQAIAMLSNPNIVSVYDVSRSGNLEYIVMELIDGITLKQYINRKGLLNWKETLHFATQIVKALSHAHQCGIIHRDIKPHNIMILKDGSVKVTDFGIARIMSNQNTLTQEALGSVHYISPEQAKGAQVDARSDLYSLGVVMYEMLTSRLPFVGDTPVSVAIQHISAIPLMPREINPDIPVGIEEIAMHAMEPNLDQRYESADEILADLESFRKNPSIVFGYSITSGIAADGSLTQTSAKREVAALKTPSKRSAELTKEEYRENKKRNRKTGMLVGVLCVVIFAILAFLFMWNYFLKDLLDPEPVLVTIPDFQGEMLSSVQNNKEYDIYNFDVTLEFNEEYPEGYIIEQSPLPERQQALTESGINIRVVVSSGTEPVVLMPDFLNEDYREAKVELDGMGMGLNVEVDSEYDDNVTEGNIIQQIPKAGEPLPEGGTVYLIYSLGPEIKLTTVPGVTGMTQTEAVRILQSKELGYKIEYVDSEVQVDVVIDQSIDENEEVPEKTVVVLTVSSGSLSNNNSGSDNDSETEDGGLGIFG
ncbi:MAG: Stk1 family PASTA domain-containing Ser/Thr kinase [Oscillospiraceae bacterium]|nr:Stk1 family PASTA domain-containing Ser/Thr kinase [Oscillospiraceae bacterium]